MRTVFLSGVLLLAMHLPAPGLVLWGLDNSANQTDPGSGAPWSAVAKVTNSGGSLIEGSAVYLGNGFMLTANHVTMNLTYSFVTFDQVETFAIDPTFNDGVRTYGKQVAPGVDLAVFKLTSIPVSATAAVLLPTANESFGASSSATLVGWGVGRSASSPVGTNTVGWGDAATSDKRWGLNAPRASTSVSYSVGSSSYTNSSLVTYAGTTNSPIPGNKGLGSSEAGATLYDSGSGLFQQIDSQWYLVGLTTAVQSQTASSTTFGLDSSGSGDANYFARISSYDEQITALVPEPSTVTLLALSGAAAVVFAFRRRR
jgi:hypothetical protein